MSRDHRLGWRLLESRKSVCTAEEVERLAAALTANASTGLPTASSSRTFAGTSSTTRIRGWGPLSAAISLGQVRDQRSHHASCLIGRVKRKVLPLPAALSTQRRPPWSSTSFRE